jgi:hypothetical protein
VDKDVVSIMQESMDAEMMMVMSCGEENEWKDERMRERMRE